jgi:hypothetical protein
MYCSLVAARRGQRQRQEATLALEQQLREVTAALEETQERRQQEIRGYDQVCASSSNFKRIKSITCLSLFSSTPCAYSVQSTHSMKPNSALHACCVQR